MSGQGHVGSCNELTRELSQWWSARASKDDLRSCAHVVSQTCRHPLLKQPQTQGDTPACHRLRHTAETAAAVRFDHCCLPAGASEAAAAGREGISAPGGPTPQLPATAAAPAAAAAAAVAGTHPILTWERRDHGMLEFMSRLPPEAQQVLALVPR